MLSYLTISVFLLHCITSKLFLHQCFQMMHEQRRTLNILHNYAALIVRLTLPEREKGL